MTDQVSLNGHCSNCGKPYPSTDMTCDCTTAFSIIPKQEDQVRLKAMFCPFCRKPITMPLEPCEKCKELGAKLEESEKRAGHLSIEKSFLKSKLTDRESRLKDAVEALEEWEDADYKDCEECTDGDGCGICINTLTNNRLIETLARLRG